jgi:small subunit ribosomal protein S2
VIPGNDDAIRACSLITKVIADALQEGQYLAYQGMSGRTFEPEFEQEPVPAGAVASPEETRRSVQLSEEEAAFFGESVEAPAAAGPDIQPESAAQAEAGEATSTGEGDAAPPDTTTPEAMTPEATTPVATTPAATVPEATSPEPAALESTAPEPAAPDTAAPDEPVQMSREFAGPGGREVREEHPPSPTGAAADTDVQALEEEFEHNRAADGASEEVEQNLPERQETAGESGPDSADEVE